MKIFIQTKVQQSYKKVYSQFDKDLFQALNPPLLPVQLVRFDGSKKGDEVHLSFPFGMKWVSHIIEEEKNDQECFFIDKGMVLPFPLKEWTHRHRVIKDNKGSTIVDDIEFKSNNILLDYVIFPVLWLQFIYRKPIYRKYFSNKEI